MRIIGKKMRFLAVVLLILQILLIFAGTAWGVEKKIKIVATTFPLYDFAQEVGGDAVDVQLLLPPGVEAHGYSPTPQNIIAIHQADLFLYTGAMEPWVEDILKGVELNKLQIINANNVLLHDNSQHHHKEPHHEDHHHKDHRGLDPHFWLDPIKVKRIVSIIANKLEQLDPKNLEKYRLNAKNYRNKLSSLDKDILQILAKCRLDTIIYGGHFVFGHFCKRYNLKHISPYKGFSSDARPTPSAIIELIKTTKNIGSKFVFHEELVQPKVAELIAEEANVELVLLHGAHNISQNEYLSKTTYLSIMQDNLNRLKKGLECQ